MITRQMTTKASNEVVVSCSLVVTKHLASIKILTDLTYVTDLTIDEKLECCQI